MVKPEACLRDRRRRLRPRRRKDIRRARTPGRPSSNAAAISAASGSRRAPIPRCRPKAPRISIATPTSRCRTPIRNGRQGRRSTPISTDYAKEHGLLPHAAPQHRRSPAWRAAIRGQPGWTLEHQQSGWRDHAARISISSRSAPASSTNRASCICPGEDGFKAQGGQILHSSQYTDPTLAKGKKVVVLGGSKSATDIAVNAVNAGAQRSHDRLSRAGLAHPLFHRRARSTSSASSTSARRRRCSAAGASSAMSRLAHRDRQAADLGELARAGKPAEGAAEAQQMQHGPEGADRGRRQLLGADRNARLLSDGRRRPDQGHVAAPSTTMTARPSS